MKQKPLVTIYITNHNYGKFIKKAIESVLSQTYRNFELIIIDDGFLYSELFAIYPEYIVII